MPGSANSLMFPEDTWGPPDLFKVVLSVHLFPPEFELELRNVTLKKSMSDKFCMYSLNDE